MINADTSASQARRATIDDVAAAAGVSVATVSRALRGLPNVAESTRQRVSEVAASLSYRPDPAAARLAAGRTSTVTVAVPSLNGWYFSTVVAGAETVCADAGLEFQVIAISSRQQRDRLLDELHRIERRTDGLILVDITLNAEQAASLRRRGVGLATIGSRASGSPSLAIDDERVGRIAAEHLVTLGHERLAVIGGVVDGPLSFDAPRLRRQGFEAAIAAHGISLPDQSVIDGQFSVEGGYGAMSTLLDSDEPPTAVFAMSDEMAFGALMALDEAGLTSGIDVSVIGVDDHEFSQVVGLTTIQQPVADHGTAAARLLIDAMAASDANRAHPDAAPEATVSLQPDVSLVLRSTTAPPPPGR